MVVGWACNYKHMVVRKNKWGDSQGHHHHHHIMWLGKRRRIRFDKKVEKQLKGSYSVTKTKQYPTVLQSIGCHNLHIIGSALPTLPSTNFYQE